MTGTVNADFGTWDEEALEAAAKHWEEFVTNAPDDPTEAGEHAKRLALGIVGAADEHDVPDDEVSTYMAAGWLYADGALTAANNVMAEYTDALDE